MSSLFPPHVISFPDDEDQFFHDAISTTESMEGFVNETDAPQVTDDELEDEQGDEDELYFDEGESFLSLSVDEAISSTPPLQVTSTVAPSPTSCRQAAGRQADTKDEDGIVDIIGGKYKNRTATFVRWTEKKVWIKLGEPENKEVCLRQDSIRFRSQVSEATVSPESTQSPRTVEPTPNYSIPEPVFNLQTPTSPQSKTQTTAVPFDSNWCVPGGHDLLFHSSLGLREDFRRLIPIDAKTEKDATFAFHLFGNRLITFKVPTTVKELPRKYFDTTDNRTYELLCTKLHRKNFTSAPSHKRPEITAQYIVTDDRISHSINLQDELEKVAGFGRLTGRKVAARLELLQSTAHKSNSVMRDFLIFDDLLSSDFEIIPELANEGCGFIPRAYIEQFLGNHAVGRRTFAIQVRIFATKHGIFKGVLMEKDRIEKIQLPSSMMKVCPSEVNNVADKACLLIASLFPSDSSIQVAKLLKGELPRKTYQPNRLKEMIPSLLELLSVPKPLLKAYQDDSHGERGRGLQHAFVVGLADPTGSIPAGSVFVTGVLNTCAILDKLFVTRCPCTEAADGHMLPVVQSKPETMAESDWRFLKRLQFGGIVFGNSSPPLPQRIANGDLDGDLYFLCWNQKILAHINAPSSVVENEHISEPEASIKLPFDEDWLRHGQDVMRDIQSVADRNALIGKLYKLMEEATSDNRPSDAVRFGRAYKEAIDIGKHGGEVMLPSHLWSRVPDRYHQYLSID